MARPLHFPPELLLEVFSHLRSPPCDDADQRRADLASPTERNTTLFSASLVCQSWSRIALEVLYGDIYIWWRKSTATQLAATLAAKPAQACRIRSLHAHLPSRTEWNDEWKRSRRGRAVVAEAERQWPPASLWDRDGRLRRDFRAELANVARLECDDADWIDSASGKKDGEQSFWLLVGDLIVSLALFTLPSIA